MTGIIPAEKDQGHWPQGAGAEAEIDSPDPWRSLVVAGSLLKEEKREQLAKSRGSQWCRNQVVGIPSTAWLKIKVIAKSTTNSVKRGPPNCGNDLLVHTGSWQCSMNIYEHL